MPPDELGGLIGAGHELGICRLLAIRPLPDLEKAEEILHQIEWEMEALASEHDPARIQDSIDEIFPKLRTLSGIFGGNIRRRIGESVRYKNIIDSLIKDLTILPVSRFKSYMVKNREIVDNTIRRAQRLLNDYNRVFDDFRRARDLAAIEVTANENKEIKSLQRVAEIVLFFPLLPYYVGNLLLETVHTFCNHPFCKTDGHNHSYVDQYVWGFALAISFWFTLWRGILPQKAPKETLKQAAKLLRPSVAFALVIMFLVIWNFVEIATP